MNEEAIEELGAKPLQEVIAYYGSWPLGNSSWNSTFWNSTFMDNFVNIQKYLRLSPLFEMSVGTDLKNSTQNVINVSISYACEDKFSLIKDKRT